MTIIIVRGTSTCSIDYHTTSHLSISPYYVTSPQFIPNHTISNLLFLLRTILHYFFSYLSPYITSPSSHYLTLITLSHPHHITSLYFTPPHTKYEITSSHAISHHFTSPLSISCSLHLVTPSYFTPHYFESNHHTRSRDSLLIITVLLW